MCHAKVLLNPIVCHAEMKWLYTFSDRVESIDKVDCPRWTLTAGLSFTILQDFRTGLHFFQPFQLFNVRLFLYITHQHLCLHDNITTHHPDLPDYPHDAIGLNKIVGVFRHSVAHKNVVSHWCGCSIWQSRCLWRMSTSEVFWSYQEYTPLFHIHRLLWCNSSPHQLVHPTMLSTFLCCPQVQGGPSTVPNEWPLGKAYYLS